MSSLGNKKLEDLHKSLLKMSQKASNASKKKMGASKTKKTRSKHLENILKGVPEKKSKQPKQAQQSQEQQQFSGLNQPEIIEENSNAEQYEENTQFEEKFDQQKQEQMPIENQESSYKLPQESSEYLQQLKPSTRQNQNQTISQQQQAQQQYQALQIQQEMNNSQISNQFYSPQQKSKIHKDPPKRYAPITNFTMPKYFHHNVMKMINNEKSYSLTNSELKKVQEKISGLPSQLNFSNTMYFNPEEESYSRDFIQENIARATTLQVHMKRGQNFTSNKTSKQELTGNKRILGQIISPQKKEISQIIQSDKQKITNYYIELLRKVELIKFTANQIQIDKNNSNNSISEKSEVKQNSSVCLAGPNMEISIENVMINDQLEAQIYEQIIQKFGEEYYMLLKKIFTMFVQQNSGKITLTHREMKKFVQYFELIKKIPILTSQKLEIIMQTQIQKRHTIDFKDFVEILFNISKISFKVSHHGSQQSEITSDQKFKLFIDEYIKPELRKMNQGQFDCNIEKIKIFYEPYSAIQNPIVELFYEMDNLLKHIFSLYESSNLKIDQQNYLTLANFTKFCKDYLIIPLICRIQQVVKLFRTFQKGAKEIIYFPSFVMIICCIAHIGFLTSEYEEDFKGFFKKIQKLFEILLEANSKISEDLMNKNLNKLRD